MKYTKLTFILIITTLLLTMLACRFGISEEATAPASSDQPAQASTAVSREPASSENPGEGAEGPDIKVGQGTFVLNEPNTGLDSLTHYRQTLTSTTKGTTKGKAYDYSQTVERVVAGSDETDKIEATTDGQSIYLFNAKLGETLYSQKRAGQGCQAAPAGEKQPGMDLARQLPPVYGAVEKKREALDGVPAVYYIFDEKAVVNQTGKNGEATGKMWVAEQGGMVLKYELTVQIKDGDFIGTRTWNYTLTAGDQRSDADDISTVLPEPCQPLLTDFPTLPGAADIQNQPGFMRYTTTSTADEARQFFLEQLPLTGWEPLPATSADPDPKLAAESLSVLTFVKANPDGTGRLAVIQLNKQGGGLTVIIQTAKTKSAVQLSNAPGDIPEPPSSTDPGSNIPQPPLEDDNPQNLSLPEDVPVYEGAKVITQAGGMVMFTTTDAQDKVTKFYESTLTAAGWEKTQDNAASAATIQMWEKGNGKLMIAFSTAGDVTRVVITIVAMP